MDHALLSTVAGLTKKDFEKYKQHLQDKFPDDPNTPIIQRASTSAHLVPMVAIRGAGFQKFLKSTLQSFNPYRWHQTYKHYKQNTKNTSFINREDHFMAKMAQEAYKTADKRQAQTGRGQWQYVRDESDDRHAVYKNNFRNQMAFALRGTAGKKDILPDLSIVAGTVKSDKDFKASDARLQELMKKFPDQTFRTIGHSLGGAKAMFLAQKHGIESYAFNPGFNAFTDDQIDTGYDGHHVYVTKGDPVSNSILVKDDLQHLKVQDSISSNPLKNHSIDGWQEKPK